jgi:predicted phage terminase large subunit-like protein
VSPNAAFLQLASRVIGARQAHLAKVVHSYDWRRVARPDQLPPGEFGAAIPRSDWRSWIIQAGRGWGKTRVGAETVRMQVAQGRRRSIALVAPTLGDGRKYMIDGPSGILAVSPKAERPIWRHEDRQLVWPNGARGYLYTSEEPERARGGNHDFLWGDEAGSWRNAAMIWKLLRLALRITGPRGDRPQSIFTLTPRPTELVRRLISNPRNIVTRGNTYDNAANLDPDYLDAIREEFEGTRLGKQEIEGELLGDTPGAMFKMSQIERLRVQRPPFDLQRVVVAIDPAVADAEERRRAEKDETFVAETGIIVAGVGRCLCKGTEGLHAFILDDVSGYYQPEEWARAAVKMYRDHKADRIVAEVNNGGALVGATLRAYGGDSRVPYKAVTASRGKETRAEPIATFYEKGEVHHVGVHPKLEDQLTTWNPLTSRKSPDRLDAAVWALTDLMLGPMAPRLSTAWPAIHGARRI